MNEYIPSTAEVRDAYSSESTDPKYANRSFDLWLAKYKAKTIAKAEERIIKLLETDCKNASIEFAIALIKGEAE